MSDSQNTATNDETTTLSVPLDNVDSDDVQSSSVTVAADSASADATDSATTTPKTSPAEAKAKIIIPKKPAWINKVIDHNSVGGFINKVIEKSVAEGKPGAIGGFLTGKNGDDQYLLYKNTTLADLSKKQSDYIYLTALDDKSVTFSFLGESYNQLSTIYAKYCEHHNRPVVGKCSDKLLVLLPVLEPGQPVTLDGDLTWVKLSLVRDAFKAPATKKSPASSSKSKKSKASVQSSSDEDSSESEEEELPRKSKSNKAANNKKSKKPVSDDESSEEEPPKKSTISPKHTKPSLQLKASKNHTKPSNMIGKLSNNTTDVVDVSAMIRGIENELRRIQQAVRNSPSATYKAQLSDLHQTYVLQLLSFAMKAPLSTLNDVLLRFVSHDDNMSEVLKNMQNVMQALQDQ